MTNVVSINNVTKKFGETTAVNNVSLSIEKSSTVAILGPNGAGKTTTIFMMLGLLEPSKGSIEIFDSNPKSREVREKIGAMLQEVSLVDKLKVREILELYRTYYRFPLPMKELIEITGLEKKELNKWANKLSGGQKRRIGYALALAGNPDLIFLDEPTVGLDISARKSFWERIDKLKSKGKTIIFTTHYLQEADDFSERILLFNEGEIIADGKPNEIKARLTEQKISFKTKETNIIEKVKNITDVIDCYLEDNRVFIRTKNTDVVMAMLYKQNFDIEDIQMEQGRLEDVFELLTNTNREVV
ncbi:ABC transporter ATP-binding protein [Sediminibacillus sp. JSM 1682029]|uniref:ABC transporter ATP-binding protein n=1 Tax=Sediminibacillus sp. JSM 1682029 TaxID=3229857 RepID=UPI003524908E